MFKLGNTNIDKLYLGNTQIAKAYLGTNLVYNNSGSGTPQLDTDGLIAYWNYEDSPVNGNWVDRVNSFKLQLGGTATKTSDGYRLNNLSYPRDAYMLFSSNLNSVLNNLIDKTFTCIVDCYIKYNLTGKISSVIDFGSLGSSTSGISIIALVGQSGSVSGNFKTNGNSSTNWTVRNNATGNALPIDNYVHLLIKLGTHILSNGTLEAFLEANNVRANAIRTTPIKVNFSGCGGSTNLAFGLGVTYLTGTAVTLYAPNELCDVYYKKVLIYNKHK